MSIFFIFSGRVSWAIRLGRGGRLRRRIFRGLRPGAAPATCAPSPASACTGARARRPFSSPLPQRRRGAFQCVPTTNLSSKNKYIQNLTCSRFLIWARMSWACCRLARWRHLSCSFSHCASFSCCCTIRLNTCRSRSAKMLTL